VKRLCISTVWSNEKLGSEINDSPCKRFILRPAKVVITDAAPLIEDAIQNIDLAVGASDEATELPKYE